MKENCNTPTRIVTSGFRTIQDGSRYNPYFPPPEERDRVIINDGEVTDTVELMEKVVWKYLDDTKRLAPLLQKSSTVETCQAIWEFIYSYIQYKLDKPGLEQLRRPARTWVERSTGVDCDCMSIFASSILTNLQIPHSFRITKYSSDSWQHVYVIVPLPDSRKYCVIDGVVSQFNFEKTYSDKMDYTMNLQGINVAVLSGVSGSDLHDAVMATDLMGYGLGSTTAQEDLDKLYQNLVSTRNAVAQNPSLVSAVDDPVALLKMLDYAIQYWYTDKRAEALDILSKNEHQLNIKNGLNTVNGLDYDPDDLALSGINIKGFFNKVKDTVKTVGSKVGELAKNAVKAMIKFNPLSLAARGGFLLAMKLNLGKMASKLKWAYGTKEQAAAKNVSADSWQKAKNALAKIESLFADKLQGSRSALQNAILKGRAGNLSGIVEDQMLGYLGDPVTGGAIVAATPVIIAAIKILKETGLMSKHENIDVNNLSKEAAADPNAAAASAEIQNSEGNSSLLPATNTSSAVIRQSAPGTADPGGPADAASPPATGRIMDFIKKNPVPVAIGGGLLVFGIYQLVKPKKTKSTGLSGHGKHKGNLPSKKKSSKKTSKKDNKVHVKPIQLF